ncbi:MAG: hypothetical protein AB4372_34780 [Xenococcus sp. (in: cyanobacteria)]
MTNGSLEEEKNNKLKLEIYNTIRDHIKHENILINNRLTWLLTLQGFLLAGLGLLIRDSKSHSTLIFIFVVLGVSTNIITFMSIWAAQTAIEKLDKSWADHPELSKIRYKQNNKIRYKQNNKDKVLTLLMKGAGIEKVHKRAKWATYGIPLSFLVAWILIFILWCLNCL